jgi:hypothetical protein
VWLHCRLTAVQDCRVEHFASFSPAQKVWLVKIHMARSSGVSGGHSHHLQCSIAANCLCPSFSLLSITIWPFALARAHHQGVAAHGGYCCVKCNDMQQYAWLEVGGLWSIHQKGCSLWGHSASDVAHKLAPVTALSWMVSLLHHTGYVTVTRHSTSQHVAFMAVKASTRCMGPTSADR